MEVETTSRAEGAKKRFVGGKTGAQTVTEEQQVAKTTKRVMKSQIPEEILNNLELREAMKRLPNNYNFEILKSGTLIPNA